ncbi:MAG: signal peptidase I [Anaeroplasmataceae bacterium]
MNLDNKEQEELIEDDFIVEDEIDEKKFKHNLKLSTFINLPLFLILLISSFIFFKYQSKLSIVNIYGFYILMASHALIYSLMFIIGKKVKDNQILQYTYKIFDIAKTIIGTLALVSFVILFLITPTTVKGESMQPTLRNGENLLVSNLFYEPKINDVIILEVGKQYNFENSFFVKRVVATENSKIQYIDQYLTVDGEKIQIMDILDYKRATSILQGPSTEYDVADNYACTVPKNYSIVFGDNRDNSTDSRVIGLVNNKDIVGKVLFSISSFKIVK